MINFATYLERLVKFSLLCNNICKFLMGTGHNFQRWEDGHKRTKLFPCDICHCLSRENQSTLEHALSLPELGPLRILSQYLLLYSQTFTQLNRDFHWLILGHMALTKIKCIQIVIHLSDTFEQFVPVSRYITARDQSMVVKSGMTEGGKNTTGFHFWGWKQQGSHHKHEATTNFWDYPTGLFLCF